MMREAALAVLLGMLSACAVACGSDEGAGDEQDLTSKSPLLGYWIASPSIHTFDDATQPLYLKLRTSGKNKSCKFDLIGIDQGSEGMTCEEFLDQANQSPHSGTCAIDKKGNLTLTFENGVKEHFSSSIVGDDLTLTALDWDGKALLTRSKVDPAKDPAAICPSKPPISLFDLMGFWIASPSIKTFDDATQPLWLALEAAGGDSCKFKAIGIDQGSEGMTCDEFLDPANQDPADGTCWLQEGGVFVLKYPNGALSRFVVSLSGNDLTLDAIDWDGKALLVRSDTDPDGNEDMICSGAN